MAEVKMIRTVYSKNNTTDIPIVDGQLIYVLDTGEIYLDKDSETRQKFLLFTQDCEDKRASLDFVANQTYFAGDLIFHNNYWYSRKTNGSSATFDSSEWDQISFENGSFTNQNYSLGANYSNYGLDCIVVGSNNLINWSSDSYSMVIGQRNKIIPNGCAGNLITGADNSIAQTSSTGQGVNNNFIIGYSNKIVNASGTSGTVLSGSNNTVTTTPVNSSLINGYNNTIGGSGPVNYSFVTGSNNTLSYGNNNVVEGESNEVVGNVNYAHIGGYHNIVKQDMALVFGKWNKFYESNETTRLVTIGNGTSSSSRSNIVEVTASDVTIDGNLNVKNNDGYLYNNQSLLAPIETAISWFSPVSPSVYSGILEPRIPNNTNKYVCQNSSALEFANISDLNTYLSSHPITDWASRSNQSPTYGHEKYICLYIEDLNWFFVFTMTAEDPDGGDYLQHAYAVDDGTYSLEDIAVPGCSIGYFNASFNITSINFSSYGSAAGYLVINIEGQASGEVFSSSLTYELTACPGAAGNYSTAINSKVYLWTEDYRGWSYSGGWDSNNLNLDNIMSHDYAKALQTQYNINWIASTLAAPITYKVGSIVIYNNNIYMCTTENSDTTWDATHWQAIGVTTTAFSALEQRVYAIEHPSS